MTSEIKLDPSASNAGLRNGQIFAEKTDFSSVLDAANKDSSRVNFENNVQAASVQSGTSDPIWGDAVIHCKDDDGNDVLCIETEKILTEDDKIFLGWPCYDNEVQELFTLSLVEDRIDGVLKGKITNDYVFGNVDVGLPGLINSVPHGDKYKELLMSMLSSAG